MVGRGIQLGGEGGKKTGECFLLGPTKTQSPKLGRLQERKQGGFAPCCFWTNIPKHKRSGCFGPFIYFIIIIIIFFMVGAHMFLFSSFFACFCFFRKQFWANFLCFLFIYFHFIKVPIYTQFFFKVYNVLLFVLSNRDMIVNLYKLYFQSFHF